MCFDSYKISIKTSHNNSLFLPYKNVYLILQDLFIGGTVTGAATMIWVMTALMKTPRAMKKIHNKKPEKY